ncbi:flavin reductase family protein [Aliidiomarina celeris]|uniref:flavin reductase family protein n=1 Tax=Aliidiomarina celeris TaxID=2249428 RepID=UPI000DEBABAF|nr:flavin reductase [Aliidiomarina celeris]
MNSRITPEQTAFTQTELANLPSRKRARLINSLSGYKSANLIGTQNQQGQTNLAVVSSVVHLGSSPALFAMVMRPHTVRRDTLENIRETGVWTQNAICQGMLAQAHQTSAAYPRELSEFEAVGLTAAYYPNFLAPYVVESPLQLGFRCVEITPIKHNQTELVIGEMQWVKFPSSALQKDGYLDLASFGTAAISGLDAYHVPSAPQRFAYAELDKKARLLPPTGTEE